MLNRTVYLPDGRAETLVTETPRAALLTFLREHMGADVENLFREYFAAPEDICEDCPARRDAEGSADSYSALCQEADDNLRMILAEIEKPRINKAQLTKRIRRSWEALHNNL